MNLSFISTTLLCLLFAFSAAAQTEISATLVSMRAKAGSAVEHLGKEKFYKVVPPTDPAPVKGEAKRFSKFNQSLGLDAKRVKGDEKVDKSFEITTNGIENIIRFQDEPYTDSLGAGFIRKIFFYFPVKVVVKNGAGEIEKELIVVEPNEEVFGIFHANMLAQATLVEGARPIVSFKDKGKMESEYETNKAAIIKRLERNHSEKLFRKVEKMVNAGYGENKYPSGYLYYYGLSKQSAAANAEVDNQCNQLKSAIAELSDKTKEENSFAKISTCYDFFKKQLDAGINDQGLLQLSLANGAIAALISGHVADADAWFSKFFVSYGNSGKNKVKDFASTFETLFEIYGPYYAIKQATSNEIHLNQQLKGFDDKKKNDERIAAKKKATEDSIALANALPNYVDADGELELSKDKMLNGNFLLKGKITYDFNRPTMTNASGVTFATKVHIVTNGGTYDVPLLQIERFSVGKTVYIPIVLQAGYLEAAANLAAGDLSFGSFWELLQETDGAIFVQKVKENRFAIRFTGGNGNAFDVEDVIKNRKFARGFFSKCPQMLEAINRKEIKEVKTREDLRGLYQWMVKNCK